MKSTHQPCPDVQVSFSTDQRFQAIINDRAGANCERGGKYTAATSTFEQDDTDVSPDFTDTTPSTFWHPSFSVRLAPRGYAYQRPCKAHRCGGQHHCQEPNVFSRRITTPQSRCVPPHMRSALSDIVSCRVWMGFSFVFSFAQGRLRRHGGV